MFGAPIAFLTGLTLFICGAIFGGLIAMVWFTLFGRYLGPDEMDVDDPYGY